MKNQKGFSLVELLVVVIIIAIIAAIAIPNLLASRRAANEASAISSLRTIHSAEATYQATLGSNTTYTDLAGLSATPDPALIDSVLGAAVDNTHLKSGYFFELSLDGTSTAYCTLASPGSSTTGTRIFLVSSDGVIYQSAPDGSTPPACTDGARSNNGAGPLN
jgi:prepilin-type N-terminal cleavage/methylation domain-containing protein